MSPLESVAVLLAGGAAGTINVIVGSGSLITFPTLVAFGVPPVTANVSSNIGLFPAAISGSLGYRRELAGQRGRLLRLGTASLLGGTLGAVLLLVLPSSAFKTIVPALIGLAVVLVIVGPRINRWVARRAEEQGVHPEHGHWWVWPALLGSGMYGGYFGAAQGVLMLAILGIGVHDTLQRNNATKNVLGGLVNGVAAVIFTFVAEVDWSVVALLATGSIIGGYVGASVGRRLPAAALRVVIVIVGTIAMVGFALKL